MEQCFRSALWVFFLIGYIQARYTTKQGCNTVICLLKRDVKCDNVTFTYPENMYEVNCSYEVLKHFKDQLDDKARNCTDKDRIGQIVDELDNYDDFPSTNLTECKLGTQESQFEDFMKHLEDFVEFLNNKPN